MVRQYHILAQLSHIPFPPLLPIPPGLPRDVRGIWKRPPMYSRSQKEGGSSVHNLSAGNGNCTPDRGPAFSRRERGLLLVNPALAGTVYLEMAATISPERQLEEELLEKPPGVS